MTNARLAIVVLTYAPSADHPRAEYARRTVRALKHAKYDGPLTLHIADDGSYPGHARDLLVKGNVKHVSFSNAERGGYGKSFNTATQLLHWEHEYLLMIEDDWELSRPLDLNPLVEAMAESNGQVGCVRLGYIGWTQRLNGVLVHYAGQSFLGLDPDSPEPHVWAGHPRLESRAFQRKVGPWTEGLDPGSTEMEVARRRESREGVVWPLDLGIYASMHHNSLFRHIGAVQAREDQVEVAG